MINFDLKDIPFLLKNHNKQIEFSHHAIKKMEDHGLTKNCILNCMKSSKLLGILKQDTNKFKLYYTYPSGNNYDLVVIIGIHNPHMIIRIVTIFKQISRRRERL